MVLLKSRGISMIELGTSGLALAHACVIPSPPGPLRGIALNDPVTGSSPHEVPTGASPLSGPLPHHLVTDVSLLTSRTLVRSHHPAEYHPRDASSQSPTVINLSIDPLPSVSTSKNFPPTVPSMPPLATS